MADTTIGDMTRNRLLAIVQAGGRMDVLTLERAKPALPFAGSYQPLDSGLGDFGDLLLPRLVDRGRVYAHRLPGYWRELGQPHHYLNAHLELVEDDLDLFDASWPIRTQQPQRPPAYVAEGARVCDSLVSPGASVSGTVSRSVLGPGVVVEAGAEISESVVFADTVVRASATVVRSVVDTGCELLGGARVGSPDVDLSDPGAIPIVGRDCRISTGLPAGARVPPGSTH